MATISIDYSFYDLQYNVRLVESTNASDNALFVYFSILDDLSSRGAIQPPAYHHVSHFNIASCGFVLSFVGFDHEIHAITDGDTYALWKIENYPMLTLTM